MIAFRDWHDIHDWAKAHGYNNIAKRMELNNDCWMSSGEFGRSQVAICDALRYCSTEEDRHERAKAIEKELEEDIVTQLTKER